MTDQLSLMGFDPPPARSDRLFLALQPDAASAAAIVQTAQWLRQRAGLTGKLIAPDRLHITLHHLGDHAGLPQGLLNQVERVATSISAPGFELCFDRVMSFARPRHRPVVLVGGEALDGARRFQHALGLALTDGGLGACVDRTFTPHVTMLYDDREVLEQPVPPLCWTAQEFVLVHSLLGRSTHRILGRWPLVSP